LGLESRSIIGLMEEKAQNFTLGENLKVRSDMEILSFLNFKVIGYTGFCVIRRIAARGIDSVF
jgi:hypothetical protein